jgi:hypothetical protein
MAAMGCDGVLVVAQEGRPPLLMTRVGRTLREIARDGGQADREPELLEFALDLPRPPAILEREAVDQLSQLPRDPRPPGPASGESAPIEPEALAVPADDGLRLDDDQHFLPARPKPLQCEPEGAIQGREPGPGSRLRVDGELLAKSELDHGLLAPAPEKASSTTACSLRPRKRARTEWKSAEAKRSQTCIAAGILRDRRVSHKPAATDRPCGT